MPGTVHTIHPSELSLTNIVIEKPTSALGVTLNGKALSGGKLVVQRTGDDSPAAGLLLPGDVIVSVNGVAATTAGMGELRDELRSAVGRVDIMVERAAYGLDG